MSPWTLMALPFLECLVLVGIHSYLGIHVIKRKVIFVDLALAQIAALGAIVGLFVGIHPHTMGAYVFSLLFTFIGAAIFSLTRLREEKIPQEAVIGLVYALAAAVTILVIDRAPHGAEHIKEILTGTILWVKWQTVLIAAIVYSAVGIFHYIFRDRFFLISNDPSSAYNKGISVRLWDFLFYMSFGLVITVSVHTAGVLLVFVFLVVPAIMAILITDRLLYQLLIGWGVGVAVSFLGLMASYTYDFPSGPMIVAVYGATLLLGALILYVVRSKKKVAAIGYIAAGILGTALIVLGFHFLGDILSGLQAEDHHHGPGHNHELIHGPSNIHDEHQDHQSTDHSLLKKEQNVLLEKLELLDLIGKQKLLSNWKDTESITTALTLSNDEEQRLALAERLVELDDGAGRKALFDLMIQAESLLFRNEAFDMLKKMSDDDFGFDPLSSPQSKNNTNALVKWRNWLRQSGSNIQEDISH